MTPSTDHLMALRGVRKGYESFVVLDGIDWELAGGTAWALLGPNGAGKTTLLRLLAGLSQPDAGTIVLAPRLELPGAIGLVTHQPLLHRDLTARENLVYAARLHRLPAPRERADELLRQLGLAAQADRLAGHFSRGMVQRLSIARALLPQPPLLLLDEPFSGLDRGGVRDVRAVLMALRQQGLTLVISSHLIEQIDGLVTDTAYLCNGKLARQHGLTADAMIATYDTLFDRGRDLPRIAV